MDIKKFIAVSNRNAEILQECLTNRVTDLSKIEFWEDGIKGKDLAFDQLLAKSYDILGCCSIGAIPSVKKTGADGYVYFADDRETFHEVETKLCGIETKNIFVGARNGLYWSSDPNNFDNRATLKSYFSGKFDVRMTSETLESKKRYTSLICFDRDQNQVIDAWIMHPEVILTEIKKRQHNASIDIKLNRFMSEGIKMGTKVNKIGWHDWQNKQINLAKEHKRFI